MTDHYKLEEFTKFANMLADESQKIIMNYFRQNLDIETKEDDSPVTNADKNSELKMRELIHKKYPNHGIYAEEFEDININSEFVWVIDPIDGTRSFIAGHKDFGSLIALLHNKKPVLGIINCPAHNERWIGINNLPTTLNGKRVKTSNKNIESAYAFTSGLYFEDENFKKGCDKILAKCKNYRFGGDCYSYGMLASGLIDVVIEDTLKIHDYMALVPVIEGAGGVVTDINDDIISIKSTGSIVACANLELHKEIIKLLKSN